MITLVFRDADPETICKGPVRGFRIDGERVTDGHGGLLARHADHCWHVDGRKFLRLDCADAVTVRFERGAAGSETYGPFTHFSSTDGICYADHEVFAHFDEDSRSWFSHRDRSYWPSMVVESLSPA